ncbi:SPFH domain-containing protein [Streptomyces sp. NPDC004667]|uniref:SPFH domain-containing protein n=1 Tax=Streptomyces sp. NPDC004667 TaxID=3154285 RepID=UPI0033BB7998
MYPTRTTFTTGTFHPSSRRPTPVAATHRTWGSTPAVEPQRPAGAEPTPGPRTAGPTPPTPPTNPEPTLRPTPATHPAPVACPAPAANPEPTSRPVPAATPTLTPAATPAPAVRPEPTFPDAHPVPAVAPGPPPASHPSVAAAASARSAREASPAGAPYPAAPTPAAGPEPVAAGHPGRWVTPEAVVVGRPAGPEEPHSARPAFPSAPEPVFRAGHPARPEPVAPPRSAPAADPGPVAPARPAGAEGPYPAWSARPADAVPSGPVAVPAGRHTHPADPPSARAAGPEPVVGRPAGPEEPHPVRPAHPADAEPALRAAHPAEPEAVAVVRPLRAADPVAEPYAGHPAGRQPYPPHPADPEPYQVPAAGHADGSAPRQGRWVDAGWPPARGDVPAARAEAETGNETGNEAGAVTGAASEAGAGTATGAPTATAATTATRDPAPEPAPGIPHPAPQGTGVPGPGVAEIVARAVARGMDETQGDRGARGEGDTLDIPLLRPPHGTAVTDVPVHLPFRAHHRPPEPPRDPRSATPRRPAARPTAGRRVPRGDDRLREHRGPVLPGWIAVITGGLALAGCTAVLWRAGVVPAPLVAAFGAAPRAYRGLHAAHWPPLALLGIVALLALGGLGRARAGHAWVLTLFGRYRGTVRRTGLTWISPLLLRQRVDVRLRHWRSEPMPAVDSGGLALQVVVQVVWQVKDTARATLAVEDHTDYLAEQVESAMARVLSQLPADAFHEDAPTLRDAEAVGDALTRMLAAETEAVGIEVFSAQPTRIEYAPEVAEAMRRRRVAAIDARHRDTVLTAVVDAVDDTVHRLTSRGIVELDDYERKALVKDLTVAFYTGRGDQ